MKKFFKSTKGKIILLSVSIVVLIIITWFLLSHKEVDSLVHLFAEKALKNGEKTGTYSGVITSSLGEKGITALLIDRIKEIILMFLGGLFIIEWLVRAILKLNFLIKKSKKEKVSLTRENLAVKHQ